MRIDRGARVHLFVCSRETKVEPFVGLRLVSVCVLCFDVVPGLQLDIFGDNVLRIG
jgi:hypothetical protein